MKIAFLKDYPEFIDELNELFFREWNSIYPEFDKTKWKERLIARTNRKEIPTTIIAIDDHQVLGSAAIVRNDMRTRQDLSPWLAGVYVKEHQRLKEIGSKLIIAVEALAKELKVEKLYLYTPDKENFYKRLGWDIFEKTIYQGAEVSIMVKEITVDQQSLRLVELTIEMEQTFWEFYRDLKDENDVADWVAEYEGRSYTEIVQKLKHWRVGKDLPASWVPASSFFLVCNGTIVGRSSLRHELNERLRKIGGHIGYYVRPCYRRKGYGTAILKLTLDKAKQLGLERVLVTCDDNNIASIKIIEKNGGLLEDTYQENDMAIPKRRYWIDLRQGVEANGGD